MTSTVVTIPKTITKGEELVLITRKKFEELLNICQRREKVHNTLLELDQDLDNAIAQVKRGEAIGPFNNAEDLLKSLQS